MYEGVPIYANECGAFAVSGSGTIVGQAGFPSTTADPGRWQHAMVWQLDGTGQYVAQDLNDLVALDGFTLYSARAINDYGDIVCIAHAGGPFAYPVPETWYVIALEPA